MQEIRSPAPCVVKDEGGNWMIFFDGQQLVLESMTSSTTALEAWLATFWVFSVQYPEALRKTCLFLEKYIIQRDSSVVVPAVVTRLITRLKCSI